MINNSKNIATLDLFRGVAGYGVAVCHFYYYLYNLNNFQFYSIFFVEFFFVLSGFVLFPQLKKVYNDKRNIKIFYLRRWYRTIPPYVVALICYSMIFTKFDSDTLKYLFFIQKVSEGFLQNDYFSIAWSLSVEEFFYLIFPIFLILLNKKKFFNILILFIILIYFFKLFYLLANPDQEFYRVGTFLRLDAIAIGVLTRIYIENIKNILLNIFLATLIALSMNYFYINLKILTSMELFVFVLLLQVFSINIIIIFINFDKLIVNRFLINFFSLLSKQTYSIYLFHFIIIYFIGQSSFLTNNNLIFIFYLISLFIFSTAFFYFFEKNIIENRPSYKTT